MKIAMSGFVLGGSSEANRLAILSTMLLPEAFTAEKLFYQGKHREALNLFKGFEAEDNLISAVVTPCQPQLAAQIEPEKKVIVLQRSKTSYEKKLLKKVALPEWLLWCLPAVKVADIPIKMTEIQLLLNDPGNIKKIQEYWVYGRHGVTVGYGDVPSGCVGIVVSSSLKRELEALKFGSFMPASDYAYLQLPKK